MFAPLQSEWERESSVPQIPQISADNTKGEPNGVNHHADFSMHFVHLLSAKAPHGKGGTFLVRSFFPITEARNIRK
jgi:hypothetical protein